MVTPDIPDESASIDSETLFNRYANFVASFLYRMGAREAEIDDMVQDVFLTAHRKGGYRPGAASPTTFLARLALEARLATRRRDSRWRSTRSEEVALAMSGDAPTDPHDALAARRVAERLEQALHGMDEEKRAVFVLFELQGESCDAIAAGLGVKVGTVHSRLHAARRLFRDAAERPQKGDDGRSPRLGDKETA
jgi:RNA polymerase sigma-70 factor (ECF subfamily)